jgi:hypothetical protein
VTGMFLKKSNTSIDTCWPGTIHKDKMRGSVARAPHRCF